MIDQLTNFTIVALFFLFPIFFLPITPDSYEYNKMALLITSCLILIFFQALKIIKRKRLLIIGGSFDIPLFFLTTIVVISALFQSPNLAVALTTPLSTTTIVAGTLLYFLLVHILYKPTSTSQIKTSNFNMSEKIIPEGSLSRKQLMNILIFDAVLLSLYTILLYLGFLPQKQFTPAGTLLATTMFLTIISVYLISFLVDYALVRKSEKESPSQNLKAQNFSSFLPYIFSFFLISVAIILLTYHLLTDQKPTILPFSFGWAILLEILKSTTTLLMGIGPANFITAFSLAKPISFNLSNVWNIIFTSSSSFLLTLTTEAGIIAAFLYLFLLLKSFKLLKLSAPPYTFSLISALALQLILPGNMSVFTLTIIFLALASKKRVLADISFSQVGKISYLFLFPLSLLFLIALYFCGRAYLAEVHYKNSLNAMLNNQGKETYEFQNQAIKLNPYLDRYHLAFSKTNLVLANTIAAKEKLSQEDTQNIPRLVQQAIDHARTAVVLYRTNVLNWDNLAKTYASLVNFAPGAEDWAITSYQQKLLLDVTNPANHLALGGIYLNSKRYSQAEDQFRQAVHLKPDFANAHYNLSIALYKQGKYQEVKKELQTTLSLLRAGSDDALKIEKELRELAKLIGSPQEATPSAFPPETESSQPQTQTLEEIKPSPASLLKLPEVTFSLPQPPTTP